MSAETWRSVENANRKLKEMHRSVSGANRKAKELYRSAGGANRKVFSAGQKISSVFTPASNVSGTPTYSTTVSSDGISTTITMTTKRTTSANYNTDRNAYHVYFPGIKSGDSIVVTATDSAVLPSQAITIMHNGNMVKDYNVNGQNRAYSFTATATADLAVELSDGDYNLTQDTMTIVINSIYVNGVPILYYT